MLKSAEDIFLECEINGCIKRLEVLAGKLGAEGLHISQWTCEDAIALIQKLSQKEKSSGNTEVSV